ncbi:MAG TPA: hypothetical protein VF762_05820 [Blastocatellia bacterium]|jgi:hypothetical protein
MKMHAQRFVSLGFANPIAALMTHLQHSSRKRLTIKFMFVRVVLFTLATLMIVGVPILPNSPLVVAG